MENEEPKFKVGDKVYVRGDDVLHIVERVVPMCRIIDGKVIPQEPNYWVSDGMPFSHREGLLTSMEEKIGRNKVVTDCINEYVSKIAEEINKVAVENGLLKKELTEEATKADVYKRDAENLQRTLEEAGEEIEELKKQLAELPKKICEEIKNSADYLSSGFFGTWLKIDLDTLDAIQEKYTKGETK